MCGQRLGNLELTDGVFIWPEGLDHYLLDHGVRLPQWFVDHVRLMTAKYEESTISDLRWSRQASPSRCEPQLEADDAGCLA
jgi:hypothetical protein